MSRKASAPAAREAASSSSRPDTPMMGIRPKGGLSARMRQTTLGVDVLGVVRPEAMRAVAATRNGRIGLLATPTTVDSGAYEQAVATVDPHVTLQAVACPTLAAIIQRLMRCRSRSAASRVWVVWER